MTVTAYNCRPTVSDNHPRNPESNFWEYLRLVPTSAQTRSYERRSKESQQQSHPLGLSTNPAVLYIHYPNHGHTSSHRPTESPNWQGGHLHDRNNTCNNIRLCAEGNVRNCKLNHWNRIGCILFLFIRNTFSL